MADDNSRKRGRIDRRKFVGGLGAGAGLTLAGCIGDDDDPDDDDDTEATASPTPDPADIVEGGTITVGMAQAPTDLNPMSSGEAYESFIWANVYDSPTITRPDFGQEMPVMDGFAPWIFGDWELNEDNIGGDDPAITATMIDDEITFHDGEPLTAEDYVFTVDYLMEQNPAGTLNAVGLGQVEEIDYDSPDGDTVNVWLEAPELEWLTAVLGKHVLPKHIWEDVPDAEEHAPLAEGDLIGSGIWEVEDYAHEEWYEISVRDSDEMPMTALPEIDWIHDDAPFLDTWRVEIFGETSTAEEALADGDIQGLYLGGGVSVETAIQLQDDDDYTVHTNADSGYYHISFNLLRQPFDDRVFRQFLDLSFDKDWVIDDLNEGIAGEKGDYAVIPDFEHFRPDPPWETDEYEGIELGDRTFPGDAGNFSLDEDAIGELRDFLSDHADAAYDYTWEETTSEYVDSPDGLVLHVNGEPLEDFLTDNEGNSRGAPIELLSYPPDEMPIRAQYTQRWAEILQEIGVPVETEVITFSTMVDRTYTERNFDMFTMGWALGVSMTHFYSLYHSDDIAANNAMAYGGADDIIDEDNALMDFDDRVDTVPRICAQMYYDAPTSIVQFHNLLEPTSDEFIGWIDEGPGSPLADKQIHNVRLNPDY